MVTAKEFAEMMGVRSVITIYNWIDSGMPCEWTWVGQKRRFKIDPKVGKNWLENRRENRGRKKQGVR